MQWSNNIHEIEIAAGDGTSYPITGSGDQWHYHSHMELTFFSEGMGTLFIGDAITHFEARDLVLIGPNLPHYWQIHNQSAGCALQFDFDKEHPFWSFPETHELHRLWKDAELGIRMEGSIVDKIGKALQKAFRCGGMERLMQFMQILNAISRTDWRQRKTLSRTAFAPIIKPTTYKSLQQAIKLIFQNFQEDISFNDILQDTGMSKATFERHFNKLTGRSFTRFLSEVRLNYAGRQLIETNLSVSEIAFASGYNNLSHFNHQFKALYGITPRTFRIKMNTRQCDYPAFT